jgi:hypothetical protein
VAKTALDSEVECQVWEEKLKEGASKMLAKLDEHATNVEQKSEEKKELVSKVGVPGIDRNFDRNISYQAIFPSILHTLMN